ncbi:ABC transporter permease [Nocardia sp. NBC_01329]|uniref:ABC transporter permease n=1 Tax=Nocardia sp. NBC_01329 TaxID=2903594 RepID=UPI002E0DA0A6|nr:ABC transporter permease [Nocardia sp. NBC_01329]
MTTLTAHPPRRARALADSWTMLRRNLLQARRYPSMTISVTVMPIVLMAIFNYVFGGALEPGLGGDGGTAYIDYLVPGMLLLLPAYLTASVAISVCTDVTKGIVNRFRTMAISRSALLTGHALGVQVQAFLALVAMLGVSLLMGFRPSATPLEWIATIGFLLLVVFSLTWLSVAFGLIAPNPESASNLPFPILMLPFLGSGLVPTDTMPTVMRWFAEYQPFTPFTETVRGLLMGSAIGNNALISLGWCLVIGLGGFFWSTTVFRRQGR